MQTPKKWYKMKLLCNIQASTVVVKKVNYEKRSSYRLTLVYTAVAKHLILIPVLHGLYRAVEHTFDGRVTCGRCHMCPNMTARNRG